jgi:carbon-monoxide dehydrogenase small subunit
MRQVSDTIDVAFTVNGETVHLSVSPDTSLVDALRDDLELTGTKQGCGEGECGACSVLLNGKVVNSCLVLAVECAGAEVLTIEGLGRMGKLHPLQDAFVQNGAVQCGFCTPGMVMAAYALLQENPSPSEADVRRALEGNLCRCTGYRKIIDAVMAAANGGPRHD